MPSGPGERYDFFLSRRGSVAAIAQEVTDVLTEKDYKVFVQDYDIPVAANFIEEMHEAIKNARDLVVLFAPHVYQDLVGIRDVEERRSRILAAAEGRSLALEPPPRPFIGVPPRIASFTGRADELNRLDTILMHEK